MTGAAALFLVKALVLAFWVTPLWDVPDETGHYAIVADLSEGRGLPLQGKSAIPSDVVSDWTRGKSAAPCSDRPEPCALTDRTAMRDSDSLSGRFLIVASENGIFNS